MYDQPTHDVTSDPIFAPWWRALDQNDRVVEQIPNLSGDTIDFRVLKIRRFGSTYLSKTHFDVWHVVFGEHFPISRASAMPDNGFVFSVNSFSVMYLLFK